MVRIRMKSMGRRHRPFFRICIMDSRTTRDGRAIEEVGHYDPMSRNPETQTVLSSEPQHPPTDRQKRPTAEEHQPSLLAEPARTNPTNPANKKGPTKRRDPTTTQRRWPSASFRGHPLSLERPA